ncbi:MAG: glycerol-3-phosphate 1-O-acyltransferase PlsY [Spirosomaceae bacterium]|jgi:glycerol-3-phosphate acyltransferase PlsY|nr:glycerol-3-phosphate 1-O-acyltransferase PlsY [Spirosomataceae bacterium]
MIEVIIGVLGAYLLGSIPTAVWYGRVFHGVDIRNHGSGNAGATNSLRVLGKKAGVIVLLIDLLKGYMAISLAGIITQHSDFQSTEYIVPLLGLAVVVGHIFPIFAQFKGGKGVATSLGVILAIHPLATLICLVVFLLIVFTTKYVSLGSMLGALTFPVQLVSGVWGLQPMIIVIFGFVLAVLLVITHRENVKRLLAGNENKFGAKK